MYTVSKPKYFSKKDIDDLNVFLKTLEEYIKKMELKQNNCHCDSLTNENKTLKIKLNTINTIQKIQKLTIKHIINITKKKV